MESFLLPSTNTSYLFLSLYIENQYKILKLQKLYKNYKIENDFNLFIFSHRL